ncbi:MAG TPA: amidohydrolase family protein [Pyrinomonadaceae bacterium]|jgi:predicted TIM-barrel fold metal-dependent hydrolase
MKVNSLPDTFKEIMNTYQKKFKILLTDRKGFSALQILALCILTAILAFAAMGQTTDEMPPPVADYHIHIQSLSMSKNLTPSQLPVIELPKEFEQLLRDKEKFGGRIKNKSALTNLYTKDTLVLEPRSNIWLRGERALQYVFDGTVIAHLQPTAYEMNGSAGFIIGVEMTSASAAGEPASSFQYVLRKEADGKWRISSESFTLSGPPVAKEHTPESMVAELDDAGIQKAVALSTAFVWGSVLYNPPIPDEYAKVKAENDWIAKNVSRFPNRLVGFCSFNPLKDYALEELDRCAKNPHIKGLKFHFSDSGVNLRKPEHVEKVRRVFSAANERRMPIAAHIATLETVRNAEFNRQQAEAFLNEILPVTPDITVQIAHMAGDTGYPESSDAAMEVFGNAIAAGDKRTKNLYFDAAVLTRFDKATETRLVKRMRQIGMNRILNASDRTGSKNPTPGENWKLFLQLPLTRDELKTVAGNVLPYLR